MKKPQVSKTAGWVISIAAFMIGYGVVYAVTHYSPSVANGTNYLTSNTEWRDYTSTKFGFKMSFPGDPIASNSSIAVSDVNVPTTTYERDNGSSYYAAELINYPSQFDMSDVDARLEGALNGSVQNTKGATLTSSKFIQFAGYRAINGTYSVASGSDTILAHELGFLKGNQLFVLITTGASDSDFSTFSNSFQFIQ